MALYYKLFHGRATAAEGMDDWGADGPTIGPFDVYAETYECVKLLRMSRMSGLADELLLIYRREDLIFYRGVFYGDREVYSGEPLAEPVWPVAEDFCSAVWTGTVKRPKKSSVEHSLFRMNQLMESAEYMVSIEAPKEDLAAILESLRERFHQLKSRLREEHERDRKARRLSG